MSFKHWKKWLGALPWSKRWLVLLIVVRPLLDMLYPLKEISPLLSPLNIAGVLSAVLIVTIFVATAFEGVRRTAIDVLFLIWGSLLVLSCCLMLTLEINLDVLALTVRFVLPFLLFFFMRYIVRSKNDLHGILTTFLYSTLVPFLMVLYEQLYEPLKEAIFTRGFYRFEGLFADVVSYSIYVIGALLIACYFFLDNSGAEPFHKKALRFIAVGVLAIHALINMHHLASWFIVLALLSMFIVCNLWRGKKVLALLLVFCGAIYLVAGNEVQIRMSTALQKDIAVAKGVMDSDVALHGRVSRWRMLADDWKEQPVLDKMMGVLISAEFVNTALFTSGPHNDFIRILLSTGFLGLFVYLLIYVVILIKSIMLPLQEKFLVAGSVMIMLMMSITMTPTLYIPLLYYILPVLAYAALINEKAMGAYSRPNQLTKEVQAA